jgi:hypothetical protein
MSVWEWVVNMTSAGQTISLALSANRVQDEQGNPFSGEIISETTHTENR